MRKLTMLTLAGVACGLLAMPAVAAHKPATVPGAWPAETISGKITMVKPDQKLLVVVSHDGTPYDIVVSRGTRIKSGNQSVTLKVLEQYQDKNVTIKFLPERRGDVAESIRIG